MTPDREVPIGALLALGLQEQEAKHLCDNKPTVLWHHLCRKDGALALAVLTPDEFALIKAELARAGVPGAHERTQQDVLNLVWLLAGNECPEGAWYSHELHSSVACALLLRMVAESWGFDEEATKQRELENFGKLLGVAANVEAI
jgi:hypothetical protein